MTLHNDVKKNFDNRKDLLVSDHDKWKSWATGPQSRDARKSQQLKNVKLSTVDR